MKQWQNRQKKIAILAAGILSGAAIVFTGCGDGNIQEEHVVGTLEAQPILSSLEVEIVNMETKYCKGELTREEYLTLAKDYGEIGRVREERDLLEQSYRLYDDTEAFELLQTLTVNLVEEEPQIRQAAETLTENLTQDDTVGEAIQALTGEEWFRTLMPKLREGQRSYYLDGDGELYFQVGYGADGAEVTKVWYTAGGRSVFLQNTENTLKIVICTGDAIASYYLDAGTGSITREQGTMKNDVLTGEYTCDIYSGENGVDLSSLWNSRGELEYATYQGEFDDEGKTLLEQPSEAELKKLLEGSGYQKAVLYAYDASTGRCLWQGLDSDAAVESYYFGGAMLGLQSVPEYSAYEAQPMAEQNAEETSGASGEGADGAEEGSIEPGGSETADNIARVRVFDGEIQWYDGKYWVSAGKAADLIQEDPFLAYEERENASGTQVTSAQFAEGEQPGEPGENSSSAGEIKTAAGNKNIGTVTLASNKPTADNKTGTTSTTKPAATPKPSTTNKPSATNKPSTTTNTAGSSINNGTSSNNSNNNSGSSGGSNSSGSGSGGGSSSGGSSSSGGNSSSGGGSSSGGSSSSGSGSSSSGSTNSGGNSSSGGGSSSGGSSSDSGSSSGGSSGSDSSGSSGGGGGSDSGGSSGGGSGSDSGSSSGGSGSDSGGSSGGDVDVDWSPDIM